MSKVYEDKQFLGASTAGFASIDDYGTVSFEMGRVGSEYNCFTILAYRDNGEYEATLETLEGVIKLATGLRDALKEELKKEVSKEVPF